MPVEISGKTYWTVAERLTLAHGDDIKPVGVKAVVTTVDAVGNMIVCRATVQFADGRAFTGHSMVNADSRSPAERNAPLETCETSAIGRALAFAGYFGSPEGIAGAEELHLAQEREKARAASSPAPAPRPPARDEGYQPRFPSSGAAPRPLGDDRGTTNYEATPAQIRYMNTLWDQAGRALPPPDMTGQDRRKVSMLIEELRAEAGLPPSPARG
jgi:hypothetical protein